VSIPFDLVETGIRDKFRDISETVNITLAQPLSAPAAPLSFCQDKIDVSWIDDTVNACTTAIYIAIGTMLFVAIVLTIANALWIRRIHLKDETRVEKLEDRMNKDWLIDMNGKQELARDLIAQAAAPVYFSVSKKTGERMFSSETKQKKWNWYGTSFLIQGF
jgi:ABC-type anion transport system duplicated permease subunit